MFVWLYITMPVTSSFSYVSTLIALNKQPVVYTTHLYSSIKMNVFINLISIVTFLMFFFNYGL